MDDLDQLHRRPKFRGEVSQNHHISQSMIWYIGKRKGDNVNPKENFNLLSQSRVSKLTRHETPDLFDSAFRKRLHTHWKFKSLGQVSREARCSNTVDVGEYFETRPATSLEKSGTTTTCREYTAMRDDSTAGTKGVLGDNIIFGPFHDAQVTLH